MEIIKIHQITKDYGQNRGVFDLSFEVKKGEVLGFLGPNGSGKTTTIRQLMGFIKPDQGTLSIFEKECFNEASFIQENVGYLPGEIAFMDSMNGMEFIRFIAKMKGMKDLGRAEEFITLFDLNPSGKIEKMSKGMKQKIGIVCAFMQDPDLLILDEPTSGLDPLMQNIFIDVILKEKARGKTILLSSHMFEEIEKTCDRAVIIRHGRLVAIEEIAKLRLNKKKIIELYFKNATMADAFAFEVNGVAKGNNVVSEVGNEIDDFLKKASRFTVTDIQVRNQNLEEFFMHFYGGDQS